MGKKATTALERAVLDLFYEARVQIDSDSRKIDEIELTPELQLIVDDANEGDAKVKRASADAQKMGFHLQSKREGGYALTHLFVTQERQRLSREADRVRRQNELKALELEALIRLNAKNSADVNTLMDAIQAVKDRITKIVR